MNFKLPFKATPLQVATYLLGVALFSISFLVFLNASVSFVITDLIGQKENVGDAVGTLGFADELVVLFACPLWGMLSDKLGVRTVIVIGYAVVGISLFVFVQAENVYPELLLARLLFSLGAAATSTMVTAILPSMSIPRTPDPVRSTAQGHNSKDGHSSTSQIAGFVGMFTGVGALLALGIFLPLPARFQREGYTPAAAVRDSYYVVGSVAFAVALACGLGLAGLAGEEDKGLLNIVKRLRSATINDDEPRQQSLSLPKLLLEAITLGFTNIDIALGYVGGFVARASSVGISLFIPLYVNAYFVSTGLCNDTPDSNPTDIKENCRRAYVIAAALSGISQLVALICAPLFGYIDSRFRKWNAPLLTSSVFGVIGYMMFAKLRSPEISGENGSPAIFAIMALLGISQIGAIVCSLSSLGRGIQGGSDSKRTNSAPNDTQTTGASDEHAPLIPTESTRIRGASDTRSHLKGTIAGVYSLAGGAGILLLTKLGGTLFDKLTPAAPFYMLAIFNACLAAVCLVCGALQQSSMTRSRSIA